MAFRGVDGVLVFKSFERCVQRKFHDYTLVNYMLYFAVFIDYFLS